MAVLQTTVAVGRLTERVLPSGTDNPLAGSPPDRLSVAGPSVVLVFGRTCRTGRGEPCTGRETY
ncbi:hypothetical protein GCM10010222_40520 [Streptomyces tanashiensis]|nr:hypothetical protein GCM10010222_40520 [Streptomyces tanashiensis]